MNYSCQISLGGWCLTCCEQFPLLFLVELSSWIVDFFFSSLFISSFSLVTTDHGLTKLARRMDLRIPTILLKNCWNIQIKFLFDSIKPQFFSHTSLTSSSNYQLFSTTARQRSKQVQTPSTRWRSDLHCLVPKSSLIPSVMKRSRFKIRFVPRRPATTHEHDKTASLKDSKLSLVNNSLRTHDARALALQKR